MQTNYDIEPSIAIAGLDGGMEPSNARTYNNPDDALPFGRGVVKITGDADGCKLPAGASDDFLGVTRRSRHNITASDADADQYAVKSAVPVKYQGSVWVEVEEAVNPDDDVYVRYSGAAQVQVITFSADFVASNQIDLDVDGVAMTSVVYATSHAATIAAVAAQIQSQFSQIATAVASAVPRTITITSDTAGEAGEFEIADVLVTLGSSQATATVAESFAGVETAAKGKFRNDAYNTTCFQVPSAQARWLDYDAANSLGLLALNLV